MPDTITSSAGGTITPTLVLGYESERGAGTLVHEIPGSANPDLTVRPAMLRSGRLRMSFHGGTAESTSRTAENLLSAAATFTLASTDRTSIGMTFGVQGQVRRTLDPANRSVWIIEFGFQEFT